MPDQRLLPVDMEISSYYVNFKKRKNRVTTDFRPISLINTSGKIFEKLLAEKITTFTENNNILPNHQYGFRKEMSTQDAILRFITDVIRGMNDKEPTIAIFLDIEKAYNKIWNNNFLYQLNKYGYPTCLVKIVQSFLWKRTNTVRVK